jgi:hypothetical protein
MRARVPRSPLRTARFLPGLGLQKLLGQGHLDELLLVHLHRAVAATEGDAPAAIADQLDLVVTRALEVELDQEVPVRAGRQDLHLRQHVHDGSGNLVGLRDHALALPPAPGDVLEANAVVRVLAPDLATERLGLGLEILDRDELHPLLVACLEERLGVLGRRARIIEGEVEAVLCGQRLEGLPVRGSLEQRLGGDVVDAGDDRVSQLAGQALRLVLRTGAPHDRGARTHEAQARRLDRLDELGVLGHEPVAREDVGVAVLERDRDDLADPLLLLLLPHTHVVGDAVHVGGVREAPQLGSEAARIGDRVLLREQHPVLADADRLEDVEGLLADGPAADHEDLQGVEGEGPDPLGPGLVETHLRSRGVAHYSNSRWGPAIGPGV